MLLWSHTVDVIRESMFAYAKARLAQETRRVLTREGVSIVPGMGCLGMLLQTPLMLALFDAVRQCAAAGGRVLWIPDISRPDIALALLVALVTAD